MDISGDLKMGVGDRGVGIVRDGGMWVVRVPRCSTARAGDI